MYRTRHGQPTRAAPRVTALGALRQPGAPIVVVSIVKSVTPPADTHILTAVNSQVTDGDIVNPSGSRNLRPGPHAHHEPQQIRGRLEQRTIVGIRGGEGQIVFHRGRHQEDGLVDQVSNVIAAASRGGERDRVSRIGHVDAILDSIRVGF